MDFDVVAAVVSGVVSTAVITIMMAMGPQMGMPKMDMPGMLGSMFGAPGSRLMGLLMHFMLGIVFAIIYAALFNSITGTSIIILGAFFGIVHWFIVGLMMGMMPMMHAGIKSGDIPAPGIYMSSVGMMGFIGGLMGHIVFGLAVGIVYGLVTGSFSA